MGPPRGFTLMEVVLTMAVLVILTGLSIPLYQAFQVKNDLAVSEEMIVQALRRAQMLSQGVDGDTTWGVSVASGSVVLFQGTSYASRDASFDETYDMSGSITPSGVSEVVFAAFTGSPQTTGTMTLTSSNNETQTVTINAKGVSAY